MSEIGEKLYVAVFFREKKNNNSGSALKIRTIISDSAV